MDVKNNYRSYRPSYRELHDYIKLCTKRKLRAALIKLIRVSKINNV